MQYPVRCQAPNPPVCPSVRPSVRRSASVMLASDKRPYHRGVIICPDSGDKMVPMASRSLKPFGIYSSFIRVSSYGNTDALAALHNRCPPRTSSVQTKYQFVLIKRSVEDIVALATAGLFLYSVFWCLQLGVMGKSTFVAGSLSWRKSKYIYLMLKLYKTSLSETEPSRWHASNRQLSSRRKVSKCTMPSHAGVSPHALCP